jgi:hypothetical protein
MSPIRAGISSQGAARRRALLLAALAPWCAGCPDDDAAVFVEPSIASPQASVAAETLGTTLTGSFQLNLHLGPRASGPSEVGVGTFVMQSSDQQTTLVSPLQASTLVELPVTVDVDGDESLGFTFDTAATLLPAQTFGEICGANGVVISGVIEDSLQDGATPVVSQVFIPSGC